jgi:hypothetical protein
MARRPLLTDEERRLLFGVPGDLDVLVRHYTFATGDRRYRTPAANLYQGPSTRPRLIPYTAKTKTPATKPATKHTTDAMRMSHFLAMPQIYIW